VIEVEAEATPDKTWALDEGSLETGVRIEADSRRCWDRKGLLKGSRSQGEPSPCSRTGDGPAPNGGEVRNLRCPT
jgi:hypothetical protein